MFIHRTLQKKLLSCIGHLFRCSRQYVYFLVFVTMSGKAIIVLFHVRFHSTYKIMTCKTNRIRYFKRKKRFRAFIAIVSSLRKPRHYDFFSLFYCLYLLVVLYQQLTKILFFEVEWHARFRGNNLVFYKQSSRLIFLSK